MTDAPDEDEAPDADGTPGTDEGPDRDGPALLPPAVRGRVVALAAERLGALAADQVPSALRPFARFTPAKRARLAAVPLAAALETDVVFRQRVAEGLREALPDLTRALDSGSPLPAVAPEDLAAAAYVLRCTGWRRHVATVGEQLARRDDAAGGSARVDAVQRLTEQLEALRAAGRTEAERLRRESDTARAEVVAVRRRVRELGDRAGRAEAAQRAAEQALSQERAALVEERSRLQESQRELQERLAEADRLSAASRQAVREGRASDELRLRLLLDTLLGAAAGLRRELALAPAEGRPADALLAERAPEAGGPPVQGRDPDDPALLEALLAVPLVHLVVDGYNVTKGGYGGVTLEAQRARLVSSLGALAARTGAEVTVVFDGTDRVLPLAVAAPRGVRLLFSREGETADEVIRRLARLEPPGRPVVVVSTDREVADGVKAAGARPVPSSALLRLLGR